jgi:hypothetical protein
MAAISAYTSRLGKSYVIAEKHDLIFCYIHLLLWFMSILGYIPAYGGVSLTIIGSILIVCCFQDCQTTDAVSQAPSLPWRAWGNAGPSPVTALQMSCAINLPSFTLLLRPALYYLAELAHPHTESPAQPGLIQVLAGSARSSGQ